MIILLASCIYYPPEDITHVDPESQSPEYLVNQTLDLDSDTLYVWDITRFNFDLKTNSQKVTGIEVSALGEVQTVEGSAGYFVIDPLDHQAGSYKLILNVFTHTGTGSLADKLGAELYLFTREYVLIIENPGIHTVSFTNFSVENGFLKIHWTKFKRPYFQAYKVTAEDSALYHQFTTIISDADSAFLIDSSFVGGRVSFKLYLRFSDSNGTVSEVLADDYTYRYPVSMSFTEEGDSTLIRWTKIPFNHTVQYSSSMINLGRDSCYKILSPGLGAPVSVQLAIDPVVDLTWEHQKYYIYDTYTYGDKGGVEFYKLAYFSDLDEFYGKHPMYLRKYDGATLSLTGDFAYSWDYYDHTTIALSPDRSKIFTTENGSLVQLDRATFNLISSDRLVPGASGTKKALMIKVLNDSLMYLSFNSWLTIYNYKSKTLLCQVALEISTAAPYHLAISEDGMYAANCGNGKIRIFRNVNNNSLELAYEASGTFLACVFDPVNVHNLCVATLEKNYIAECPGMDVLYEIPDIVRGIAVDYDPVTNYLLFVSEGYNTLTIYDFVNNHIMFRCRHHGFLEEFYLAKNIIFHREGYNIKFNGDVR